MAYPHLNCTLCGKPVVLVPSAAERAAKDVTGKNADYYRSLFPTHAACTLAKRERETVELMRRAKGTV
jgi:hypothetical protein